MKRIHVSFIDMRNAIVSLSASIKSYTHKHTHKCMYLFFITINGIAYIGILSVVSLYLYISLFFSYMSNASIC